MNPENQAFQGNQISVRLTDDRLQELNQLYAEAIGEPGSTVKQSFEKLLDLAFNNVKKIDRPETIARVADLEAELKQVKADLEAERLRISTFEEIESDTVAELRQQLEAMTIERDEALNSANANAMIAQQITLDDERTIKLCDVKLIAELNAIRLAVKISHNKEVNYDQLVTMFITACRKAGAFCISPSMRSRIIKMI